MKMRDLLIPAFLSGAILFLGTGLPAQEAPAPDKAPKIDQAAALWSELKSQLTGPKSQEYFEQNIKNAQLPVLAGRLVAGTPKDRPSVLTLAMYGASEADVTLRLKSKGGEEGHLNGPWQSGR
jgi:hypothetical protein